MEYVIRSQETQLGETITITGSHYRRRLSRGLQHLRDEYKRLGAEKKTMRWVKFPLSHEWADTPILVHGYIPYGYRIRQGAYLAPRPTQQTTFIGVIEQLDRETFANPTIVRVKPKKEFKKGMPVPRNERWHHQPTMNFLVHSFCAPFIKENENLLTLPQGIAMGMRGSPAEVILDKAMERGLTFQKDFIFQKLSRYILLKSEDMRLFLMDELDGDFQGLFDFVFRSVNPETMDFTFNLDDRDPKTEGQVAS